MNQASDYRRHPDLVTPIHSRLLVVDMQTKLLPHIHRGDEVLGNCRILLEAGQILGIPSYATEQYPQGLGPTAIQLHDLLPGPPCKMRFSSVECLNWPLAGEETEQRHQIIVSGIEGHVCILQTVFDLLHAGYRVYVPVDAVSSRFQLDAQIAFQRMQLAGAFLTTTEGLLFEWCETADNPEFKQISSLVKNRSV